DARHKPALRCDPTGTEIRLVGARRGVPKKRLHFLGCPALPRPDRHRAKVGDAMRRPYEGSVRWACRGGFETRPYEIRARTSPHELAHATRNRRYATSIDSGAP